MSAPQETHLAGTPAGAVRCPSCGGLNPAAADWCGQCLQRFAAPEPPPPPPPLAATQPAAAGGAGSLRAVRTQPDGGLPLVDPLTGPLSGPAASESDQLAALEAAVAAAAPAEGAEVVHKGAFTIAGDEISWQCVLCEADNALSAQLCTVCGAPFARAITPAEPPGPARDPNTVALYSLFFPGAGHAYMGNWPQAIARGVLSTWIFLVTVFAALAGGNALISIVFGLSSFGMWIMTAHDAYREASGQRALVILRGRRFLFLTLGLLGLLFVMLTAGFMNAQGA